MDTPVTDEGLRKYDHLTPCAAALKAWTDAGSNPVWHHTCRHEVRKSMPLLARALDRLASEGER